MKNTKLVDLKEGSLHLAKDYISALKSLINILEAETYMKTQCAITRLLKFEDSSGIPEQNIDGSKAISSDTSSKPKAYEFPMLKTQVDINIMSMAWNTACIPQNDRFCDFEDCIDSSEYCIDYLVTGIKKNCKAFQKTLELSDKKAKKKDSDNSEVIEASDDTSNESFFLDANVDYSNVVYLLRKLKIL
ncbi:23199_t:CDS:2 [Gigaspora rosea]|nr:23199_t:CDS:2 [Gigaspora rosea]